VASQPSTLPVAVENSSVFSLRTLFHRQQACLRGECHWSMGCDEGSGEAIWLVSRSDGCFNVTRLFPPYSSVVSGQNLKRLLILELNIKSQRQQGLPPQSIILSTSSTCRSLPLVYKISSKCASASFGTLVTITNTFPTTDTMPHLQPALQPTMPPHW
jgi:hypothetical protein